MVSEGRVEMGIAFEPDYAAMCILPHWAWIGLSLLFQRFTTGKSATRELAGFADARFITLQRPSAVRLMLEEQLAQRERNWKWRWKAINWLRLGGWCKRFGRKRCACAVPQADERTGAVCLELDNPVIERRVGVLRRHTISFLLRRRR